MRLGTVLLAACACGILPGLASAQADEPPLRLRRLSGPINFDGKVDEAAWNAIEPLPLTMYTPNWGGKLTERTEIRVAYDDKYFYVAGRMWDDEPGKIRTNTLYRDRYSGDDIIALILDTYNDRQTASWFVVNPAGARIDRSVSDDAEFSNGDPMNDNWNTFWDVATSHDESSWSAEMRIPFSSLGFQDVNGQVTMGLIAYRVIARKNERQLFPAIPPNWDMGFAKPSKARRVILDGVHGRRPVYVTPYGLGGVSWQAQLDTAAGRYLKPHDGTYEAGVDLKYSPTSNLNLDLTANTDFAQVESDDQQINLTRFSLFFPEKRQFFQERAAIFDFNTGGLSRLFHSRNIGLVDGEPIRIYGGARLVGRTGPWDLGLLDMQTARHDTLATENFAVVRLRRGILNANSTIGALATGRVTGDGHENFAAGFDAVVRPIGDQYLTVKWIETWTNGLANPVVGLDQSRMLLRWERRNQVGPQYAAELVRSGANYDPEMGFTFRNDYHSLDARAGYQWLVGPRTGLRTFGAGLTGYSYWRNGDGSVESAAISPTLQSELKTGEYITVDFRNNYESVRDTFEIGGGAHIVPGNYWYHQVDVNFMAARSATFRPTFVFNAGSFYDGTEVSLSAQPAWNPSKYVELGVGYDYHRIRFNDRAERLDLHLVRVRVNVALNVHASLATLFQHDNADHAVGVNARFRYNFREGRDLWLVYNETLNTDRGLLEPRLPLSRSRAFLVKYTHTLGL